MLKNKNLNCLEDGRDDNELQSIQEIVEERALQKNQYLKGTMEILWIMGTVNFDKKATFMSASKLNKFCNKKQIQEISIVENANNILEFKEQLLIYQKGVFLRGLTFLFYKKFLFFENDLLNFMKNFYTAVSQGMNLELQKKKNYFSKVIKSKSANRVIVATKQKNKKKLNYQLVDYEETQIKKSMLDEECDKIWRYISKKEEDLCKNDKSLRQNILHDYIDYYDGQQIDYHNFNDANEKQNKFNHSNELENLLDCKDTSMAEPFTFTHFQDDMNDGLHLDDDEYNKDELCRQNKNYLEENFELPIIFDEPFNENEEGKHNEYLKYKDNFNYDCSEGEEINYEEKKAKRMSDDIFNLNHFYCQDKKNVVNQNHEIFKQNKRDKKRKLHIDRCITIPLSYQQKWMGKKFYLSSNNKAFQNLFETNEKYLYEMPCILKELTIFWEGKVKQILNLKHLKPTNGAICDVSFQEKQVAKKFKIDQIKQSDKNELQDCNFSMQLQDDVFLSDPMGEKENRNENVTDSNMDKNEEIDEYCEEDSILDKYDAVETLRGIFENREDDSHFLPFNFTFMDEDIENKKMKSPSSISRTYSHRKSKSNSLQFSEDFEVFDKTDLEGDKQRKKLNTFGIDSCIYTPPYENEHLMLIKNGKRSSKKTASSSNLSSVYNNLMCGSNDMNDEFNKTLSESGKNNNQLNNNSNYIFHKKDYNDFCINNFFNANKHLKQLPPIGSQGLPEETYKSTSSLSSLGGYNIVTWKYKRLIHHMAIIKEAKKEKLKAKKIKLSSHFSSLSSSPSSDSASSMGIYVEFEEIAPPKKVNKITAANAFYNLLVLATHNQFHIVQKIPFAPIQIYPKHHMDN